MALEREKYLEGQVILIDKEYRWTSFDVVNKIRKTIGIKKVGHAGTLDPLATGLLIVCTGKKTKQLQQFQDLDKEYSGTFFLGAIRPSYDKETDISETFSLAGVTTRKIYNIARSLEGNLDQVPPAYSAVRKEGKRVYELARQGKEVRLAPRNVTLNSFEITRIDLPEIDFRIRCSKGFYVRSLARDFGRLLQCGGYLENLRRTAIGHLKVEDAETVDEYLESVKA